VKHGGVTVYAQHNPTQHAIAITRNRDVLPVEMRGKLLDYYITKGNRSWRKKNSLHEADSDSDDPEDTIETDTNKKNRLNIDHRSLLPYMRYTVGLRIMLTRNIQSFLGLTNEATGTIVGFLYENDYSDEIIHVSKDDAAASPPPIPAILVKFDRLGTPGWKGQEGIVPIFPVDEPIYVAGRDGTIKRKPLITRTMLPMVHDKFINRKARHLMEL
jgi:hypothetical protein